MTKRRRGEPQKDIELEAAIQQAIKLDIPLSVVCRRAQVDQSTLWKWRNGKSSPTMSTRQAVLDAVEELLQEAS